jgi:CelD/BcsL family acetyltransferase involved in cellulose biosynthesis
MVSCPSRAQMVVDRIWTVKPDLAPPLIIDAWRRVHERYDVFASPFLGPEYARLVARCRPDAELAVLESDGVAIGFFAYERCGPRAGRPIGSVFCDYQAVVVPPSTCWSANQLLKACDLDELHFDHWLGVQSQMLPFTRLMDVSWAIDLTGGFSQYDHRMSAAGRGQLTEARKKEQKLQGAVGSVRFEADLPDEDLLDLLLRWKSRQWSLSGWSGRFEQEWERRLMRELLLARGDGFGGILSVLFAGDMPVALHLGLRSRTIWHYWTTAYDAEYQRYSPGIIMLVHMAQAAERLGLKQIDLGKETFEYKMRLATHHVPLVEGRATRCQAEGQ